MEPGYQKVKSFIEDCRGKALTGYMNQINLGEVYYKTIRAVGINQAKDFLENFFRLPIEIILPDAEMIWNASEIKAKYAISYADCFAVATAAKYKTKILTGDPEFKKVKKLVPIEWI